MKRILAIGGSQFLGRVFSIFASRQSEDITLEVVNRGRHPLNRPQIVELVADRNNPEQLAQALAGKHYDAVIDFCAYEAGQVDALWQAGVTCDHYVLISTANVCTPVDAPPAEICTTSQASTSVNDSTAASVDASVAVSVGSSTAAGSQASTSVGTSAAAGLGAINGERASAEYADRTVCTEAEVRANAALPTPVKDYIIGKLAVEKEARQAPCAWTILRPAFVYGPFDYSNRLATYFKGIKHKTEMVFPLDSTSRFSFVYVKDFASLLLKLAGDERFAGKTFNVAHPQPLDWASFEAALLVAAPQEQQHVHVPVSEIVQKNLPVPFPVDTDESYPSQELMDILGFTPTPIQEGLRETWDIFKDIV